METFVKYGACKSFSMQLAKVGGAKGPFWVEKWTWKMNKTKCHCVTREPIKLDHWLICHKQPWVNYNQRPNAFEWYLDFPSFILFSPDLRKSAPQILKNFFSPQQGRVAGNNALPRVRHGWVLWTSLQRGSASSASSRVQSVGAEGPQDLASQSLVHCQSLYQAQCRRLGWEGPDKQHKV